MTNSGRVATLGVPALPELPAVAIAAPPFAEPPALPLRPALPLELPPVPAMVISPLPPRLPPVELPLLPFTEPPLDKPPLAVAPPLGVAVAPGCEVQPATLHVTRSQAKHVVVFIRFAALSGGAL